MLSYIWQRCIQFLLPTRCAACQRIGPDVVCTECLDLLTHIGSVHCLRCGRKRETSFKLPDCGECHKQRIGVTRARSMLIYEGTGRKLLTEFKFQRNTGVGYVLGNLLAYWTNQGWQSLYDEPDITLDLVIPVPLHKSRRRKRRFNQAELLARLVAQQASLDYLPDVLKRKRKTESQVGLSANQRRENVRGAFSVAEQKRKVIAGKHVLLVDDLMTTGATLAACATALRKGGAASIYGLTLFSTHRSAYLMHDTSSQSPAR